MTGIRSALVNINLAVLSSVTWHADAGELASAIDAGSQILTWVGVALIDIHLASWPRVALRALAEV